MKPLEEKTFQLTEKEALSIYARMMHTLDSSEFESFLSEDFAYSSQKVLTDMNSKDEFIEYIRPKLEIIKKTKSAVYAELGVCPGFGKIPGKKCSGPRTDIILPSYEDLPAAAASSYCCHFGVIVCVMHLQIYALKTEKWTIKRTSTSE